MDSFHDPLHPHPLSEEPHHMEENLVCCPIAEELMTWVLTPSLHWTECSI